MIAYLMLGPLEALVDEPDEAVETPLDRRLDSLPVNDSTVSEVLSWQRKRRRRRKKTSSFILALSLGLAAVPHPREV
jgi:hypothetical protein